MFKVVIKHDFVRARANFNDNFVVTRKGIPEGLWITISGLKDKSGDELMKFLTEVLDYIGIIGHDRE